MDTDIPGNEIVGSSEKIAYYNTFNSEEDTTELTGSTLDEELFKTRGNGSFMIVVSSIMISFAFAELMVFATPFLELIPPLQCNSGEDWFMCEQEQACEPGIEYRTVMDDKYSLINWVPDLDIVCSPQWKVGLLGSAIFSGMFFGALFLSPISDHFGRRPINIIGLTLSLAGSIWIYFFPNWISVTISLIFSGIGMYTRLSISYLYTLEMFDEERCKPIAAIIMSINNSLSSVMALYFILGGRDATIFVFISIFILFYSIIFIPILPESPKLLYSLKKYNETRNCLSKIAHINGLKYKKVVFKEEYEAQTLLLNNNRSDAIELEKDEEIKEVEVEADFTILYKNPKFLLNMGIVIFVFMFNVFSMYMLSFMLKYLPGDKYWNLFLLGVADFIPSVMSGVVMAVLPTKRAMILVHGSI
jgi:MFS family permease